MKLSSLIAILVFGVLGLAAISCTDDDKKKEEQPEFIQPATAAGSGRPVAPDIISASRGSGGTTALSVNPNQRYGLTVSRSETAAVPADRAYVGAILPYVPTGPFPVSTISERDREAIIAALVSIGVNRADVTFSQNSNYGRYGSMVIVPVSVADVPVRGKAIIAAIESGFGNLQNSGVRFTVNDCTAALAPVRAAALAAAMTDAEGLAKVAGFSLGPVVALTETRAQQPPYYGPLASDPCSQTAGELVKGLPTGFAPLDTKPEASLSLLLTITFALAGGPSVALAEAPNVTVVGQGQATAKANEAYIVVSVPLIYGPTGAPSVLSARDRRDLLAELDKLGIKDSQIEISDEPNAGQIVIVVEGVAIDKVKSTGDDISDAVRDTAGPPQSSGVVFSHSNCAAVLSEARKQAVADAERSARGLVEASGRKLGKIISLNEGGGAQVYGPPALNCRQDIAQAIVFGGYPGLRAFDSEPVLTVDAAISVSFALED